MSRLKTASFGRGSEATAQVPVAKIVVGGEGIKMCSSWLLALKNLLDNGFPVEYSCW
jgi:hypothetical protein